MLIRNAIKPALLALVVCMAAGGAVGFDRLLGATGPGSNGAIEIRLEDNDKSGISEGSSKCILSISQCPVDNPNCGKEPRRIEVSCIDPSCLASPQTCIPTSSGGGISSARSSGTLNMHNGNSCMLRRFECAKGSATSCYKRWRTTTLSCTDNLCGTASCLRSDMFFMTYALQPWDTGTLPGPFPRTETMCIVQSSACAPADPSCLSPVSLEQVSCDDARCAAGTCTRMSILVDQNDTIVSNVASGTSGQSGEQQNEGAGNSEDRNEDDNKGTGNTHETGNIEQAGTVETRALGCFDKDGLWTADRTQCATDQKKFVEPSVSGTSGQPGTVSTPQEEKTAERTIETQFVPDTRKIALVQNILSSTVEATGRLNRILENPLLPPETRVALEQRLESLRSVQDIVSSNEQSIRELQTLADSVANDLQSIQTTVTKWIESSPHDFPVTVTDKLDRIFTALPSVFGVLLQENVPIESITMDSYLTAQQMYDTVRGECMVNPENCSQLSTVLDALEPVYANIRLSLEKTGRTDLEEQLDKLLQ